MNYDVIVSLCSALGYDKEFKGHGLRVTRQRELQRNIHVCDGIFSLTHADLGGDKNA